MEAKTIRRLFMGAAAAPPAVPTLAQATAGRYIREQAGPAPGFDPDLWLERLKATGGNVWFTMDQTLPSDLDKLPAYLEALRTLDTEAKRAAVKIARGTDHIRDRETV